MKTILALILIPGLLLAESYIYSKDGTTVQTGPRDLPSVGVRLDNGQAVLGLHGASDSVKAACGWYRVIPDTAKAETNQIVSGRSYTLGKYTAQEVLTFATRKTITPQARLSALLDAMPGETDDERVSALIRAVAVAVTGKLDKAVTIVVPAKAEAVKQ